MMDSHGAPARCEEKQRIITELLRALDEIHSRRKHLSVAERQNLLDTKDDLFQQFRAHLREHGC